MWLLLKLCINPCEMKFSTNIYLSSNPLRLPEPHMWWPPAAEPTGSHDQWPPPIWTVCTRLLEGWHWTGNWSPPPDRDAAGRSSLHRQTDQSVDRDNSRMRFVWLECWYSALLLQSLHLVSAVMNSKCKPHRLVRLHRYIRLRISMPRRWLVPNKWCGLMRLRKLNTDSVNKKQSHLHFIGMYSA